MEGLCDKKERELQGSSELCSNHSSLLYANFFRFKRCKNYGKPTGTYYDNERHTSRIQAQTYKVGGKVKDNEYTEEFKELNIPILPLPETIRRTNSCICSYASLPRGGRIRKFPIPPQPIAIWED